MSEKRDFLTFSAYPKVMPVQTRWSDNDVYGHVNNVAYYSYFDTAVNTTLIDAGVLDIEKGDVIGLVVETGCRYAAPLVYPEELEIGLGVERLGRSSVVYRLGVTRKGETKIAAEGRFVHVYVDRKTRKAVALPKNLRAFLETLMVTHQPVEREG